MHQQTNTSGGLMRLHVVARPCAWPRRHHCYVAFVNMTSSIALISPRINQIQSLWCYYISKVKRYSVLMKLSVKRRVWISYSAVVPWYANKRLHVCKYLKFGIAGWNRIFHMQMTSLKTYDSYFDYFYFTFRKTNRIAFHSEHPS